MAGRRARVESVQAVQAVQADAVRVCGARLVRRMRRLLKRLRPVGAERDKAGNRKLYYDDYFALLLLYFYTPSLTGLRALQQTTNWEAVRRKLGIKRASLGSLSEAARVFDAKHLRQIVQELAAEALPLTSNHASAAARKAAAREAEALAGLTAADGSLFQTATRLSWALWQNETHRAVKLHLHFDVLKRVPCDAVVTPGCRQDSEVLEPMLRPGRLYVLDRGYADYELLGRVVEARSSLVARLKNDAAYTIQEERPLSEADRAAGVVRDLVISRLGSGSRPDAFRRPMRLVIVAATDRHGKPVTLTLLTDRLDLEPELVARAYRYRWTIELFFRWMKCVLGARHLVAENKNGVELQMYAALIMSLLIVLRTNRQPTKRTFELIQFALLGWVSEAEFDAHLAALAAAKKTH